MSSLGLIIACAGGLIAISVAFTALIWAAVMDGRTDKDFRTAHPELEATIAARRPVAMPRRPRHSVFATPMSNVRSSIVVPASPSPVPGS
jgi:hypothetical protein